MKGTILFVTILLMNYSVVYSQWIQTNGPYGDLNVLTVFEHDSNYFASTDLSGSYSKSSVESSWNLNSNIYFETYTIKGDSLFVDAHFFSGGVRRDLGIQLFDLNNPEAAPVTINSMITSQALKHTDTCLFGGHRSLGFFKLSFDGTVLEYHNNGLPKDTIWTPTGPHSKVAVTAIELYGDHVFCGTNRGVYRSDANLASWNQMNNGLSIGNVTFIEEILDTLYTSIDATLYYSDNGGNNWFQIYNTPSRITSFQKDGNQILVSTSHDGVYHSIDNGASWNEMNAGLTDLSVNFITKLDSVIFCGTKSEGVFRYHNGIWSDNNQGIISSLIRSLTVTNQSVIANNEDKVFILDSNGNWSDISPNVNYDLFGSVSSMIDTIFLSVNYHTNTWPYNIPFIMYSPDNGTTWHDLVNPVPYAGDDSYRIYCENARLYAREDDKLYYTDDLGINWTDLSLPSQYCNYIYDFAVYNSQPFAAACGKGQLLKLDNINNWVLSNNGLPTDRGPTDIAYCDSALFAYISVHGMYVSFDNGDSWSYANNGLNTDRGIRDFAPYGRHLFVSTENGVFVTSNYGQNWYECNDGLTNLNTSSIKILNDTLYVGTNGKGVWKRAIEDINLYVSENENNSLDFKIYPNPANEFLKIETSSYETLEIQIFDIMGRITFSKAVEKDEIIDIRNIQNGTYLITLKSKRNIKTSKLIILR